METVGRDTHPGDPRGAPLDRERRGGGHAARKKRKTIERNIVSRIVKAELKQDIDRDMETCDNVRNALVHDDSRM